MERFKIYPLLFLMAIGVFAVSGCRGEGSGDAVSDGTVSTLSLTISDTAGSSLGEMGYMSDYDMGVAAISDFTIKCKDGSGNIYTATVGTDGTASVESIPTTEKLVCYLVDSSGEPVTQLFDDDASVIGGKVDAVGLTSNTSATVSFNSNSKGASMTCTDCASAVTTSKDIDLTGTFLMSCSGVYNSTTDEIDTTKSCNSDFDNASVYLHRVQYTDTSSNTIDSYGAWPSASAYTTCGSTEGLDSLPSGSTLVTTGQSNAFSWYGGFSTITSSSTSADIAGFIAATNPPSTVNVNGTSITQYSDYSTAFCGAGSFLANGYACQSSYFWQVLDSSARASGAICIPNLTFTWGENGVSAIAVKTANGGTLAASSRYDFMNVQWYGNDMRMSSQFAEVFPAWDSTNNVSVSCRFKEDMLISFSTPGATPATGDAVSVKFATNTDVAAISGVTSDTTICTDQFGSSSAVADNGYYMLVTMTKQ